MPIMSLREYARHRGVALSAVQKAIQTKRIGTLPDGRVESEAADAAWQQNTRKYVPAVTGGEGAARMEREHADFGAGQYTKARAIREHYQARLAKVEYEERVQTLVSKYEVQVAAFERGRVERDAWLNWPNRVSANMAAELGCDERRLRLALEREVRLYLTERAAEKPSVLGEQQGS